jgi:hypothetical protein
VATGVAYRTSSVSKILGVAYRTSSVSTILPWQPEGLSHIKDKRHLFHNKLTSKKRTLGFHNGVLNKRVLSSVSSLLYMRYLCLFCTHTITFVLFIYSWTADKQTEEEPNGNRRNTNCLSQCACANSLRSVGSQHGLSSGNTLKADSQSVPRPCRSPAKPCR